MREQDWPSAAVTPRENIGDPSANRRPPSTEELGKRLSYLPLPPVVGSAALAWTPGDSGQGRAPKRRSVEHTLGQLG